MKNDIVAHFQSGEILKGTTADFSPMKAVFTVHTDGDERRSVSVADLKGLFFVHSLDGNPEARGRDEVERGGLGRKIRVTFSDGEVLHGYTSGYSPERAAFFVFPGDPTSNSDRAFVVTAACDSVEFV
jgi:hypothetical protein